MIKKRFRNALLPVKTRPGADNESDHVPVLSQIRVKLKRLKKFKAQVKRDFSLLREDQDLKNQCNIKIKNRYHTFMEMEQEKSRWEALRISINEAAKDTIPIIVRQTTKQRITKKSLP